MGLGCEVPVVRCVHHPTHTCCSAGDVTPPQLRLLCTLERGIKSICSCEERLILRRFAFYRATNICCIQSSSSLCWIVTPGCSISRPCNYSTGFPALVLPSPGVVQLWYCQALALSSPGIAKSWCCPALVLPSPGVDQPWYIPALVSSSPGIIYP